MYSAQSQLPAILADALRDANHTLCNHTLPAELVRCNPFLSGTNPNSLGTDFGESFQVYNLSNRDLQYIRADGQLISVAANYDGNTGLREFRGKLVVIHTQVHNIPAVTLQDIANENSGKETPSNGRAAIYMDMLYGWDPEKAQGSEADFPYVADMKKELFRALRNVRHGDHNNYIVYNPGNPRMSTTILNDNLKIVRICVIDVESLQSQHNYYSEYLNLLLRLTIPANSIEYVRTMAKPPPMFHPMTRVNAVRLFAEANGEYSTFGFYERIEIKVAPTYMENDHVFVVRNDEVKPLKVRKISGTSDPLIAYSTKGPDGDIVTIHEPMTNENLAKYRVFRDQVTAIDFVKNREHLENQAKLAKKENELKEDVIANKQIDVELQRAKAQTIHAEAENQREKAKNNKTTEVLKFIGTVITAIVVIVGGLFSIARSIISMKSAASVIGRFA